MTEVTAVVGRPRGRGRPARLSAEQIVTAAVAVLDAEPGADLTIKRIADAVGAAPMALYRYFPDRDALFQACADHVIGLMERTELADGPWPERVRAWMLAGHERLQAYPQLLPYMLSTEQPAWLASLVRFTDLLAPLRLSPADFALAATLISSTVISHAIYTSRRLPVEQTTAVLRAALADRPTEDRDLVAPVLPHLPDAFARLHDTVLDQTIATVSTLAQA